jgi:hypothetical protein
MPHEIQARTLVSAKLHARFRLVRTVPGTSTGTAPVGTVCIPRNSSEPHFKTSGRSPTPFKKRRNYCTLFGM